MSDAENVPPSQTADIKRLTSAEASLGDAIRQLARPSRWVFWCLAGLTLLDRLIQPSIYLQDSRAWLRGFLAIGGAIASLLGFAALLLAGRIVERLLLAWGDRIDARADWERQLRERWESSPLAPPTSMAMGSAAFADALSADATDPQPSASPYDPIRRAIAAKNAVEAWELSLALAESAPDDAEAILLIEQAERLRASTVMEIKSRIAAAKEARDPDQVLAYRDDLAPLLAFEERRELDQGLVRWLMKLFQNKLRGGVINEDVATLAARIADVFAEYPEGASMRAGLPTLRRSAGLCPRCAEPYRGIENACPRCMAEELAKKIGKGAAQES